MKAPEPLLKQEDNLQSVSWLHNYHVAWELWEQWPCILFDT